MKYFARLTGSWFLSGAIVVGCGQAAEDPGTSGAATATSSGGTNASSSENATGSSGSNSNSASSSDSSSSGGSTGASADSTSGSGGGTVDVPPDDAGDGGPPVQGLNAGAGPWGTPVAGGPSHSGTVVKAHVTVDRGSVAGNVGAGFAGFSVEKTQLANSSLTGKNAPLISLFKLLRPTVLRIGGADVDRTTWAPSTPPGPGGPPYATHTGTAMVDELADFVSATGARVIYGINFSAHDVPTSVAEATYADKKLGASIDGFEIGNEISNDGSWPGQRTQWESFGTGILKALPTTTILGPATTRQAATSFAVPFAADEAAKFGAKLSVLTQHYYIADSGSSSAKVAGLQTMAGSMLSVSQTLRDLAAKYKVPNGWRMDECNTYSGHGKMGVSDTFISGLWAIDFMFQVALNGGSGVNFHGAEDGMDGGRPFYYEPIKMSNGAVTQVMPLYYGMLFFYLAGQGPVRPTTVSTTNANFNAYAISYLADGSTSVMLVNKNGSTGVDATIDLGGPVSSASAIYLESSPAGSLTAGANGVRIAGAQITPSGSWNRTPFTQTTSGNTVSLFVPPATAALVRVE